LRSICVHVPDPKKPKVTLLRPVFDGVYVSTTRTTVTVMMVSDKAEAWFVYKKMSKRLSAWLYGHCFFLGYPDSIIKSLMEIIGPNAYAMARYPSTFNQETLEVNVELNDN
jgi:hypothetical protein